MSRKLTPLPLLLAPFPAFAADGAGGAVVGGAAFIALVLAGLALVEKTRRVGIVGAALFGILLSGYLAVQHNSVDASVCNISGTYNCDVVNRSEYSEVAGIPIALFGMAFYAVMAWLGLRNTAGGAPKAPAVMSLLAGLGVVYDLYLLWASTQLGAYCPLCMVTWGLNVVLLVGAGLLWRATEAPSGAGLVDGLKAELGSVVVVGVATLIVGHMASRDGGGKPSLAGGGADSPEALVQWLELPAGRVELDGTEPAMGPADARFVMVEWADYECPHCALMADELKKVLADNSDVRLYFKHYPISNLCNQFVQREGHKFACNAAAAAECARLQGKFWELNAQMFRNQEFLSKEDIRFMSNQIGIEPTSFEACMADASTAEAVKQDISAGGVAGVEGTPSIFVKGLYDDGSWVRISGGRDQINAVLAAARTGVKFPPAQPHPTDHAH